MLKDVAEKAELKKRNIKKSYKKAEHYKGD